MSAEVTGEAGTRRPRWGLRLLGGVLVLAALAGAAELALRLIVPGIVANAVRDSFGMTSDHPVEVAIEGSALLSALSGKVGDVSIEVPQVTVLEGITVTVTASAEALPFDAAGQPLGAADASVTIPADQLGAVIALVTSGAADTGTVSGDELQIGRDIEVFGVSVPLQVSLALAVDSGNLLVEPTSVSAAGMDLTAMQIRQFAGSSLDGVLQPHSVCVRDQLPAGVTLTEIRLSSTGAVTVGASLAPDIISNSAQLELGTCA
ncbi:LmeA family phospholipid-binding protein [Leucobacter sp. W1153]|uniref:LmeA family phospholipid-binding protein n=1 Tax=Leucobacter sp. W1153 TaxID=3439064 RepID=UPI003F3A9335